VDVCDSTFSNATTFTSLPQAFHKTQACMCLNCSLKLSSAAQGEDALPARLSKPWGQKPRQTLCCPAAGPAALVLPEDSQPGTGNVSWMGHQLPSFHQAPILGLGHHLQRAGVHLGLVPPIQRLWGCSQPALDGLTCSRGRRKASRKQVLI